MNTEKNKPDSKIILTSLLMVLFMVLIFFTSCTHGWKTYIIKAGNHTAGGLSPIKFNLDKINFDFKADSTWYYLYPDNYGWNKIRGISHGHHQNNSSARLAWRCFGDTVLVVGAYCYVNGDSPQDNPNFKAIIDTIQPGIIYHCSITRKDDMYVIDFEDKKWTGPAGKDLSWGYVLNPYIGGDFTLKHDWKIEIRDR